MKIYDKNGFTISEFGLTICRFYVFFFTWMYSKEDRHWLQIYLLNKKVYETKDMNVWDGELLSVASEGGILKKPNWKWRFLMWLFPRQYPFDPYGLFGRIDTKKLVEVSAYNQILRFSGRESIP